MSTHTHGSISRWRKLKKCWLSPHKLYLGCTASQPPNAHTHIHLSWGFRKTKEGVGMPEASGKTLESLTEQQGLFYAVISGSAERQPLMCWATDYRQEETGWCVKVNVGRHRATHTRIQCAQEHKDASCTYPKANSPARQTLSQFMAKILPPQINYEGTLPAAVWRRELRTQRIPFQYLRIFCNLVLV